MLHRNNGSMGQLLVVRKHLKHVTPSKTNTGSGKFNSEQDRATNGVLNSDSIYLTLILETSRRQYYTGAHTVHVFSDCSLYTM